ncbi:phosphoglycerate mutase family protein [Hymenobacter terrenus]|uniref:phosphoglycerate mutase family protein n=1 Tax=Hymenobacter terrenus TaxID=1629124 RepID=UPI0006193D60|nr:phosphoglycerate mutase family protein [Hymenobacter terrenus]
MTARVPFRLFLLAGLAAFASNFTAHAQAQPVKTKAKLPETTVYLVRHAEKDTTANPADPALSPVGQVRAQALSQLLARRRPAALFTTDTKRTRATLAPLVAATNVEPQVYDPKETTALAVRILKEYVGKTVVIVGHSNTLLPLIESLGGTPPVDKIADNEYDYLFTVHISEGALPTVSVRGYGPERRASADAKSGSQGGQMR